LNTNSLANIYIYIYIRPNVNTTTEMTGRVERRHRPVIKDMVTVTKEIMDNVFVDTVDENANAMNIVFVHKRSCVEINILSTTRK
jgi:hypothetical protein